MGQIPYFVFLPCPSTVKSFIDAGNPLHNSSQVFINESHRERFTISSAKNFKTIGANTLRNKINDLICEEFDQINTEKGYDEAVLAVDSIGIAHATLEPSERAEFDFENVHKSIFELAKDLDTDPNVSKIIIVCNCKDKAPLLTVKEELIQEMKSKKGKVDYLYEFEEMNTDELIADAEYSALLIKKW